MTCHELAAQIEQIRPEATPQEVARLCLLLTNARDQLDELGDREVLASAWQEAGMKLQASTDQHAAMTLELESLADSDPDEFNSSQIWVLIRAIKVQSQVLQMYVGGETSPRSCRDEAR